MPNFCACLRSKQMFSTHNCSIAGWAKNKRCAVLLFVNDCLFLKVRYSLWCYTLVTFIWRMRKLYWDRNQIVLFFAFWYVERPVFTHLPGCMYTFILWQYITTWKVIGMHLSLVNLSIQFWTTLCDHGHFLSFSKCKILEESYLSSQIVTSYPLLCFSRGLWKSW